jgi:Flp pilus assembly protein TadD
LQPIDKKELSWGTARKSSSILAESKYRKSQAFAKAIELDQAAPLSRLGLGLAKIRQSDLAEGTQEIEIAASLDPDNSLIRSYLVQRFVSP